MNTKKNIVRGLSTFVIGLGLFAQTTNALAAREHVIGIENGASQSIWGVYASNTGVSEWGPDRLGGNLSIIAGRTVALDLDDGSGQCNVNLKVVFRDGREVIQRNVDICKVGAWKFDDYRDEFVFV